ncbi:MAG: trimethylamine methyltransferase family protein [Deltaproteobacteria bacterium]|nr:trimethylamine methyltransferase family protein [Deltaproteobacteria bacterium]
MNFRPILKALAQEDLETIHRMSLKVLAETGIIMHSAPVLEICRGHGAGVSGKTVYFQTPLVEKALETCPRRFEMTARNSSQSVEIGGDECHVQPNFGPVFVQDVEGGRRPGAIVDYRNMQILAQASKIVKFAGALPVEPGDIPQETKYMRMMYETLRHTDKPLIGQAGSKRQVERQMDMVGMAVGGSDFLDRHHCLAVAVNPNSPLAYSPEALETLVEFSLHRQPVFFAPAAMAGVSGPISLIGVCIQCNAEVLAGITLTQMINPGAPVVYGAAAVPSNMKTGGFNTGTPEGALLHAASLQLGRDWYGLPVRSLCGFSESKLSDGQASLESAISLASSLLAGANIVVESLGALDSIMTTSYEQWIINEEIISRIDRIRAGMDTSAGAVEEAMNAISEVGPGGNFLLHATTQKHYKDSWTPDVSFWGNYTQWEKRGRQDIAARASVKCREIIRNASEIFISPELDRALLRYMEKSAGD